MQSISQKSTDFSSTKKIGITKDDLKSISSNFWNSKWLLLAAAGSLALVVVYKALRRKSTSATTNEKENKKEVKHKHKSSRKNKQNIVTLKSVKPKVTSSLSFKEEMTLEEMSTTSTENESGAPFFRQEKKIMFDSFCDEISELGELSHRRDTTPRDYGMKEETDDALFFGIYSHLQISNVSK
jgi:Antirepressor regulating drug resistance, predicted signal transduction N-terminal membrane component